MSRILAPALDIVAVVVFALVGRRSHAHGITLVGVLETAQRGSEQVHTVTDYPK